MRHWWRRFKRFFTRPVVRVYETKKKSFDGKIYRIVLIRGHKSSSPGAAGVFGLPEFFYWEQVEKLIYVPNKKVSFVNREGTSIRGAVMRAAEFKPDLIMELHYNAFNGKANGVTARYATPSAKIAEAWCAFTAKELGRRNRKGRNINSVRRGVSNVEVAQSVAPQAFLIEPFFGDNSKDYVTVIEMARCLNKYLTNL